MGRTRVIWLAFECLLQNFLQDLVDIASLIRGLLVVGPIVVRIDLWGVLFVHRNVVGAWHHRARTMALCPENVPSLDREGIADCSGEASFDDEFTGACMGCFNSCAAVSIERRTNRRRCMLT